MADVKFSELSTLTTTASADILAIVDDSESASKQVSINNLFGAVPVNLAVTDLTASTSNTTGSITTTGGVGVSKAVYVGGALNVFGNTILNGANTNIAGQLTIAANVDIQSTLTVNSTTALVKTSLPLHFRDTGLSLSSPTDGTLDLAADTIFEITAPTMNVISTTALTIHTPAITANGTFTIGADDTGYDVKFFGDTSGNYWLWDTSADGVVQVGTLTVGVDDTGHDVKFFGATSGNYMLWDESADELVLSGTMKIKEQSAADSDTAGFGQLWLKTETPNTLQFTNDAGVDSALASIGKSVALSIVFGG